MVTDDSNSIPSQEEGKQVDIIETMNASSPEGAKSLYIQSKQRLLDINRWSDISDGLSASFVLTDKFGKQKQGNPEVGDHFRIDIPGPGSFAGNGYDWVRVELVEEDSDPEADCEWSVIKVRPSEDPVEKEGIAHFLEEKATSSFIIKRNGNTVSAEVHGRNEKPNIGAEKRSDKIRNIVIGAGAVVGFAKIQWEKLAKGLLNKKED
jgi:hypothetical protein